MAHPFKIGGTYRNRLGEYVVLAIEGERMVIRYEDGAEQEASTRVQARIWRNLQAEESAREPARQRSEAPEGVTRPIFELVEAVLQAMPAPRTPDITDRVCLAIEGNDEWLRRYREIVKELDGSTEDGQGAVNMWIGSYTRGITGLVNTGETAEATSSLIKTYSRLAPPAGS